MNETQHNQHFRKRQDIFFHFLHFFMPQYITHRGTRSMRPSPLGGRGQVRGTKNATILSPHLHPHPHLIALTTGTAARTKQRTSPKNNLQLANIAVSLQKFDNKRGRQSYGKN